MQKQNEIQAIREKYIRELDKSINSPMKIEELADDLFALDLTVYSRDFSFDSLIYNAFAQSDIDENVFLHPEQLQIISHIKNNSASIISAPTSFGKTFCIFEYIVKEKPKNIVLIVPTLALVEEYFKKIIKKYKSHFAEYKIHTSIDEEKKYNFEQNNIFILTHDRIVQEISYNKIEKIDFLVIDEVYKLETDISNDKTTTKDGFKELDRFVSKSAINREMRSLSKMFSIAVDNGWLDYNPFFKVPKFREENKQVRVLLPEEEKTLLQASEGCYIKPILICALHTGMRSSEIKSLKWSCVNFEEGYIDVLKTKSGRPRQIPLSDLLRDELSKVKRLSSYVFTNPKTLKPYTNIRDKFTDLCEKNAIDNIRFHDLRHTAATRMVASGIDIVVVQDILGHASLSVTQRYSHPVPDRKKKAIEALNNYCVSKEDVA